MSLFKKKQEVAGKIGQSWPKEEQDNTMHDNGYEEQAPLPPIPSDSPTSKGGHGAPRYDPITHTEIKAQDVRSSQDAKHVRGAFQRSVYEGPKGGPDVQQPRTRQTDKSPNLNMRQDIRRDHRQDDGHRVQFSQDPRAQGQPYQNDYDHASRSRYPDQPASYVPQVQIQPSVVPQPIVMPIGVTIPQAPAPQHPPMYPMPMPMPYMYPPGMGMMPGMFGPMGNQMYGMQGFGGPQMQMQNGAQQRNDRSDENVRSSKDSGKFDAADRKSQDIIANEDGSDAINKARKIEARKNHLDYLQDLEKQIEEQRQKKEKEKKEREMLDLKDKLDAERWNSRSPTQPISHRGGRNAKFQDYERAIGPGGGLLIPKESLAPTHRNDPGNPFSNQHEEHTIYGKVKGRPTPMRNGSDQPPNPAELQTPVKGPESMPNQLRVDNMAVNQPQPVNTQTIVQIPDHITAEIERLTKQNAEQKTKYEQELLRLQEDLQKKIDELHKQQQTFIEQQAKIMEKASEKPKEPVKRGIEEILSIQKENIFLEREQQLLRENMLQQEDMITRLRMETEIAKMHSDIAQSEMLRIKGAIKDREIQERINGQHYNRQKPARDRVRSEYPVSTGNQTTRNPLRQERRMRKAESDPYLHDRINVVAEERHQSFRQQARSNRHRQDDTDSLIGESCLVYQDGRVARFQLDEKDDEKQRRRSHGAGSDASIQQIFS
eukprot:TRINITY_DN9498_c0_g1_i5.p1 TRINITY_DN9498_c0_g1~~TRINITY_DN9498_c0_g1_i5.p1  ORF type:complete len:713 (+),score=157.01 TRINITY_DN9498_c0_g1_i5:105-2243(+)